MFIMNHLNVNRKIHRHCQITPKGCEDSDNKDCPLVPLAWVVERESCLVSLRSSKEMAELEYSGSNLPM